MNVAVHKVARVEGWTDFMVVVGWDHEADCGCKVVEAMTIDVAEQEPVLGFFPCSEAHQREMGVLRDSVVHDTSEPDRPVHDVIVERFAALADGWE